MRVLRPKPTSNALKEYYDHDDAYEDVLSSYYCNIPDDDHQIPHCQHDSHDTETQRNQSSISSSDRETRLYGRNGTPEDCAHMLQSPVASSLSLSEDDPDEGRPSEPSGSSKARIKVVTALEDTSIFLGGLIKHPVESNRHFTVLRHSHGLVYYRGPGTSIGISVFADNPLPADRRMWLQLKGWTGNTGMAAKALFRSNNSWINVTPEQQIDASSLPPLDERAWQRDIKKFANKASKTQKKHMLRETAVVRIPYEACDGYFRILLTGPDSRAVLCPSPVFRIASTSMSASSLKGASLATLPIELGVKVAQTAATTMATTLVAPWAGVVKDRVTMAAPFMQYSGYAQTAWDTSGIQDQLNTVNGQYETRQAEAAAWLRLDRTVSAPGHTRSDIIGPDHGPEMPFPVRLKGVITKGTGQSTSAFGKPTANLDHVPTDLLLSLSLGVYFGWAQVIPSDKDQLALHDGWRHAIITITYSSTIKIARRKCVRAHLIHNFPPDTTFVGSKLKLIVMGHLRPLAPPNDRDVILLETVNDVAITKASLSRPAWGHDKILQRIHTARSARSMTDRMVDMRLVGQRQADRVPIHKLGIRVDGAGIHDRDMFGNGGVWVKRDRV